MTAVVVPPFIDASTDAPAPAPIVASMARDGCEIITWKQPFPVASSTVGGSVGRTFSLELPVATTKKRWRGVDVFVTTDIGIVLPATGVLVIRVYGRSGGQSMLVAQGLVGFDPLGTTLGSPANRGRRVCAARAAVEAFDVTAQYYDSTYPFPTATPGNLFITTVASDEVVDAQRDVGVILAKSTVSGAGSAIDLGFSAPGKVSIPGLELLSVYGVNDSSPSAPRFLQAFDRVASLAGGTVPQMVWPMGAVAGEGAVYRDIGKRFYRGLILAVSSTSATYTAVADSTIQAEIR